MRWFWLMTLGVTVGCGGDGGGGDTDDTTDTTDTTDTPDTDPPTGERPAVCINEYMSSNHQALVLPDGTAPDWIELYNPTNGPIDLGGWWLSDDPAVPDKHVLASNLRVRAGDFLVLYADDDVEDGEDHLGFSIDNDGEVLVLTDLSGRAESIDVVTSPADFAMARVPDCCRGPDCWRSVSLGSPGATNGSR